MRFPIKRGQNGYRVGDSHHNAKLTDHEIELAARALERIQARKLFVEFLHSVDAACPEVAPARVERDFERRIVLPGNFENQLHDLFELLGMINEKPLSFDSAFENHASLVTDRSRAEKILQLGNREGNFATGCLTLQFCGLSLCEAPRGSWAFPS